MTVKPGYLTTEFWASVLASVAGWVAQWAGTLSPRYAAIVTAVSAGAYAISRAITKYGVATSGRTVANVTPAEPAAPPAPAPPPVQQV